MEMEKENTFNYYYDIYICKQEQRFVKIFDGEIDLGTIEKTDTNRITSAFLALDALRVFLLARSLRSRKNTPVRIAPQTTRWGRLLSTYTKNSTRPSPMSFRLRTKPSPIRCQGVFSTVGVYSWTSEMERCTVA